MSWGVSHLLALLTGFCLDLLLGDPHWAPHPVRAVGVLIAALEKLLRRLFPKSPGGELAGGAALVALTIAIPTGLPAAVGVRPAQPLAGFRGGGAAVLSAAGRQVPAG